MTLIVKDNVNFEKPSHENPVKLIAESLKSWANITCQALYGSYIAQPCNKSTWQDRGLKQNKCGILIKLYFSPVNLVLFYDCVSLPYRKCVKILCDTFFVLSCVPLLLTHMLGDVEQKPW